MKNKYNNISILNLRIVSLIIGSIVFLIVSFVLLFNQRTNVIETLNYSNFYIIFASFLIIVLFFSLAYLLFPIFLRVRRKKISTLNSKFTLYFILIALTPSVFLGIIGWQKIIQSDNYGPSCIQKVEASKKSNFAEQLKLLQKNANKVNSKSDGSTTSGGTKEYNDIFKDPNLFKNFGGFDQ